MDATYRPPWMVGTQHRADSFGSILQGFMIASRPLFEDREAVALKYERFLALKSPVSVDTKAFHAVEFRGTLKVKRLVGFITIKLIVAKSKYITNLS